MYVYVYILPPGKLANALKNEENPQYAAMCFQAMAKWVAVEQTLFFALALSINCALFFLPSSSTSH